MDETCKQIIRLNCSGNDMCKLDLQSRYTASTKLGNLRALYGWKRGEAAKEEFRNTALACRDGVRRIKAHVGTWMSRVRKSFYSYRGGMRTGNVFLGTWCRIGWLGTVSVSLSQIDPAVWADSLWWKPGCTWGAGDSGGQCFPQFEQDFWHFLPQCYPSWGCVVGWLCQVGKQRGKAVVGWWGSEVVFSAIYSVFWRQQHVEEGSVELEDLARLTVADEGRQWY